MTRRASAAALSAAVALVLGGCGEDEEQQGGATPSRPRTEVTAVVRPEGAGGPVRRRTVDCDEPATCRRLREAEFRRPSAPVACTQVYGGPGTARVTGRVDGRPVDASFTLEDGCEIARWKRFAWLLGPPPTGA